MNEIDLRRISTPITTGIPQVVPSDLFETVPGKSFEDILKEQINDASHINFSKHAMNRVMERNIDLSEDKLTRLDEAVKLAEEKGLDDTLVILDSAAFIVSVKNNTVITTVGKDEMTGNVFTNIDGTVII